MASNSIVSYMKRLGSSVAYAAVDLTKDYTPHTRALFENNKDYLQSLYKDSSHSVQELRQIDKIKDNTVFRQLNTGWKNLKDSIRTGKFYSEERQNSAMLNSIGMDNETLKQLESLIGGDISQIMAETDGEDTGSTDESLIRGIPEITKGDVIIASTQTTAIRAGTNAIANAIASSAELNARNTRTISNLQLKSLQQQASAMITGFNNVSIGLHALSEFNEKVIGTHVQNSRIFFEQMTNYTMENNAILKEILDIKRQMYAATIGGYDSSNKTKESGIFDEDGNFNLKKYLAFTEEKSKTSNIGALIESVKMLPMLLGGFISNPLHSVTKMALDSLINNSLKSAIKTFDNSINGFIETGLAKLANYGKDSKNPMLGAIARLLGYKEESTKLSAIDTSKYNKGPMQWNGIAQKALVEVIPGHLRRIESALTGQAERVFNFQSGKWSNMSAVKHVLDQINRDTIGQAFKPIEKEIAARMKFDDPKQRRELYRAMKEFESGVADRGLVDFQHIQKNSSQYGSNKELVALISTILQSGMVDKSKIVNLTGQLNSAIRNRNSIVEGLDPTQQGLINELLNRSYNAKFAKGTATGFADKYGYKTNSITTPLTDLKDDRGYTIYDYQYNILAALQNGFRNISGGIGTSKEGNSDQILDDSSAKKYYKDSQNADKDEKSHQRRMEYREYLKNIVDPSISAILNRNSEDHGVFDDSGKIEIDPKKLASNPKYRDQVLMSIANIGSNAQIQRENATKNSNDGIFSDVFKALNDMGVKVSDTKKEENGFLASMLHATTVADKFKVVSDSLSTLTSAPQTILTSVFTLADKFMYDFLFDYKTEEKDKNGNPVTGFFGKVTKEFENITDNINNKINNWMAEHFKDGAKGIAGWLKKIAKDEFGIDVDKKIKEAKKYGEKLKKSAFDAGKGFFQNIAGDVTGTFDDVKKLFGFDEKSKRRRKNQDQNTENSSEGPDTRARGITKNTKYGLAIVGPGEAIIPADLNPWNPHREATNLRSQAINENKIKQDFMEKLKGSVNANALQTYAEGTESFENDVTGLVNDAKDRVPKSKRKRKRKSKKNNYSFTNDIKEFLGHFSDIFAGMDEFSEAAFGINAKKAASKSFDALDKHFPEITVGTLGGTLASTILPLGGPLMGAITGSALSIAANNKSFQEYVFGKEIVDKEGNKTRDNSGLVSKNTIKTIQKYLPDAKKYGITGALAGLILPFGPLGGMMIGAGASILKNNKSVNDFLFGEKGGLINKDRKERIKRAMPSIGVATLGTLFLGPFGVMGNAVLGASLGLLSTTETFKRIMLGPKDKNGERHGGIAGVIRRNITEPFKKSMKEMSKNVAKWFKDDLFNPLARSMKNIGKTMLGASKDLLKSAFDKVFGGVGKTRIGKGIVKAADRITGLFSNGVGGAIRKVGSFAGGKIGSLAHGIENKTNKYIVPMNYRHGWMGGTAEERLDALRGAGIDPNEIMTNDKYKDLREMYTMDQTIKKLSVGDDGEDRLKQAQNTIEAYQDLMNGSNKNIQKRINASKDNIESTTTKNLDQFMSDNANIKNPHEIRQTYQKIVDRIENIKDKNDFAKISKDIDATKLPDQLKKQLQGMLQSTGTELLNYNNTQDLITSGKEGVDVQLKHQLANILGIDAKDDKTITSILKNKKFSGLLQDEIYGVQEKKEEDNSIAKAAKKDKAEVSDDTKAVTEKQDETIGQLQTMNETLLQIREAFLETLSPDQISKNIKEGKTTTTADKIRMQRSLTEAENGTMSTAVLERAGQNYLSKEGPKRDRNIYDKILDEDKIGASVARSLIKILSGGFLGDPILNKMNEKREQRNLDTLNKNVQGFKEGQENLQKAKEKFDKDINEQNQISRNIYGISENPTDDRGFVRKAGSKIGNSIVSGVNKTRNAGAGAIVDTLDDVVQVAENIKNAMKSKKDKGSAPDDSSSSTADIKTAFAGIPFYGTFAEGTTSTGGKGRIGRAVDFVKDVGSKLFGSGDKDKESSEDKAESKKPEAKKFTNDDFTSDELRASSNAISESVQADKTKAQGAAPDFNKKDNIQYTSDSEGNMIAMAVGSDGTPTKVKNKDNFEIEAKHKHELNLKERSCNALEAIANKIGAGAKDAAGKAVAKGKGLFGGLLDSIGSLLNMLALGLPIGTWLMTKLKSLPGKLFKFLKDKIPAALSKIVPDALKNFGSKITSKIGIKPALKFLSKSKKPIIAAAAATLLELMGKDDEDQADTENANNPDNGLNDKEDSNNIQENNKNKGGFFNTALDIGKDAAIIGGGMYAGKKLLSGNKETPQEEKTSIEEAKEKSKTNSDSKSDTEVKNNSIDKSKLAQSEEKIGTKAEEKLGEKAESEVGKKAESGLVDKLLNKKPILYGGAALLGLNAMSGNNAEASGKNGEPKQEESGLVSGLKQMAGEVIGSKLGTKVGGKFGGILGSGVGTSAAEGDMSLSNIALNTGLNFAVDKTMDKAGQFGGYLKSKLGFGDKTKEAVEEEAKNAIENKAKDAPGLLDKAKAFAGDKLGQAKDFAMDKGKNVLSFAKEETPKALDKAKAFAEEAKGTFSTGMESAKNFANEAKTEMSSKLSEAKPKIESMDSNIQMVIGKVKNGLQTVIKSVGKWLPGEKAAKAVNSFCEAIMKKITSPAGLKSIGKKLAQQGAAAAAGGASFGIGALVVEAGFAVTNFIHGMNSAEEMLNLPAGTATTGLKVVAGLVTAICGAIPVIGAFIPEDWVLQKCIEIVGPAFGCGPAELEKLRRGADKQQEKDIKDAEAPTTQGNDFADQIKNAAKGAVGSVIKKAGEAAIVLSDNAKSLAASVSNAAGKALDWAKNTATGVGKWISNRAHEGYQWLSNKASNAWNSAKEIGSKAMDKLSDIGNTVMDYGSSAVNKVKGLWNSITGRGKHSFGYGKGKISNQKPKFGMGSGGEFYSQLDPEYAGISMNIPGDTEHQTVKDSGCGPASAANALSALGKQVDFRKAVEESVNNTYKEKDGGIRPNYIENILRENGVNSENISNDNNSIMQYLKEGNPVTLMGEDDRGETESTPFAENPHYVTATGIDSNGNIEIQDPESYTPNKIYKAKDVLSKSSIAIGASLGNNNSSSRFGRGKISHVLSSISKFGRSKFGRGGQTCPLDKAYALAAWVGERTNINPKVIFGQWYQESGGFSSDCSQFYNYGGMTQTQPNGNPQPDGNGYYMEFDSPEDWAEYYAWYLGRLDPSPSGSQTPEDFATCLKNNGYFGADLNAYIAAIKGGMSHLPNGDPDASLIDESKFKGRKLNSPSGKYLNGNNGDKGNKSNPQRDFFNAMSNSSKLVGATLLRSSEKLFGKGKHSSRGKGKLSNISRFVSKASNSLPIIKHFGRGSKKLPINKSLSKQSIINSNFHHYSSALGKAPISKYGRFKYGRGDAGDIPEKIWDFLTDKGLSSTLTAAVMGNIYAESGYNPNSLEKNEVDKGEKGHGICQWTYDRWHGANGLQQFANSNNMDWTDIDCQLQFFWYEVTNNNFYHDALVKCNDIDDLDECTYQWYCRFEMSCDPESNPGRAQACWNQDSTHKDTRLAAAHEAFDKQGKGIKTSGNLKSNNSNNNKPSGRQGIFGALDELGSKLTSITSLFGSAPKPDNNSNSKNSQNPNGGKDNKVGQSDTLDMDVVQSNHPGDNYLTNLTDLKPDVKAALNIFGKDFKQRHGDKLMITGGAETWTHADGKWSHHTGWKTDIDTNVTDEDKTQMHNMGASVNLEGDHYDIDWSGHDSRDKNTGVNGVGAQGKHKHSKFGMGKHKHFGFGIGKHSIFGKGLGIKKFKSVFGRGDLDIDTDGLQSDPEQPFDTPDWKQQEDSGNTSYSNADDVSNTEEAKEEAPQLLEDAKKKKNDKSNNQNNNNQSGGFFDKIFGKTGLPSYLNKLNSAVEPMKKAFTNGLKGVATKMFGKYSGLIGDAMSFLVPSLGSNNSNNDSNKSNKNFNGSSVAVPNSGSAAEAMKQALSCEITSPYGPRGSGFHHGVDFGVGQGTQLPTVVDGVVDDVGVDAGGYGNFIVVKDSKGYYHIFGHLTNAIASKGDNVKAGQVIAVSGHSGHCIPDGPDGSHLHYGIYEPGNASCAGGTGAVDPGQYDISGLSKSGQGKHSRFGMGKQGWTGGTRRIRAKKTSGSDEGMTINQNSYTRVGQPSSNKAGKGKKSMFGRGSSPFKSTLQEDLANTRTMSPVRFPENLQGKGANFGITDSMVHTSRYGRGIFGSIKKYINAGKDIYKQYKNIKSIFDNRKKKKDIPEKQHIEYQEEQPSVEETQEATNDNNLKDTNKLIAPNGRVYSQNDINYILKNSEAFGGAKTVDDAIAILSKDEHYTNREYSPTSVEKAKDDTSKYIAPNGTKYKKNDIYYILKHPEAFGGAKTVDDAIAILSKDEHYTKETAEQRKEREYKSTLREMTFNPDGSVSYGKREYSDSELKAKESQASTAIQTSVKEAQTKAKGTSTNITAVQQILPNEDKKKKKEEIKEFENRLRRVNTIKTYEDAVALQKGIPDGEILEFNKLNKDEDDITVLRLKAKKNIELHINKLKSNSSINSSTNSKAVTPNSVSKAQLEQKFNIGKEGSNGVGPNGKPYTNNDILYILKNPDSFNGAKTVEDAVAILSKDIKYTKKDETKVSNSPTNGKTETEQQQEKAKSNNNDSTSTGNTVQTAKSENTANNNQPDKVDQLIAAQMKTNELLAALVNIATTIATNSAQVPTVSNASNTETNTNKDSNNYASKQDLAKVALATKLNSFFASNSGVDANFINPDFNHSISVIKNMQTIASM